MKLELINVQSWKQGIVQIIVGLEELNKEELKGFEKLETSCIKVYSSIENAAFIFVRGRYFTNYYPAHFSETAHAEIAEIVIKDFQLFDESNI